MDFVKRAWRGEEKLWKVFWLADVVGGFIITKISGLLFRDHGLKAVDQTIGFIFTVWISVAVWRCANNVKTKFWGVIARVFVVLGVLAYSAGVLLDLGIIQNPLASMTPALTQNASPPSPRAAPSATAASNLGPCEKAMTDYAVKNHADPKAYIAQNQAYLQQCNAQMKPQPATAAPASPAPVNASVTAPQIHER